MYLKYKSNRSNSAKLSGINILKNSHTETSSSVLNDTQKENLEINTYSSAGSFLKSSSAHFFINCFSFIATLGWAFKHMKKKYYYFININIIIKSLSHKKLLE